MENRKRKPLSDITNTYNLIPTSALRELVAATSNPNAFSKPPFSILKSNSSSTSQKFRPESSNRSNTSVGSSNVSPAFNSKTVQFRNSPDAISSISSPGGIARKDAAYNRRQIIEKPKIERDADVVVSRTPIEKRKDKGMAVAVMFKSSPTKKMMANQYDICNPKTPVERQNQNGVANLSLSSGSVATVKESEKGILNSDSCSFEKTETGKAILNSSACALGKQTEIGKGIANNSCCSLEKTNDGNEGILKHSRSSIVKRKEIEQEFLNPSSFLVERAKDKGNSLNTFNTSHEKTKEKGKAILQASDTVETAKDKGSFGKEILNSYNRSFQKMERGKAILNSSACAKETGKGIADNFGLLKKTNDANEGILKHPRSSTVERKGIGQKLLNPSSFLVEKAKDKGNSLNNSNSSHDKTKEKGKAILQAPAIFEITKHKGSSASVAIKSRPLRRKSEKRKNDAGTSSCPPLMRNKNIQNDLDEAGDIKNSRSWTDPHPKSRKKRCSRTEDTTKYPQDFIEQQKAYFKEIDEFELPEEEVSQDELD